MPTEWIHPKEVPVLKKRLSKCNKDFTDTEIKSKAGITRTAFENALKGKRIKKQHAMKLLMFLSSENY